MNLFRYMDALDRIEEARRGPRGLLDDEWFDTYANRGSDLPPIGQGGAAPSSLMPGDDPFNDWYQARLRQALRETFARLRGQASMPPLGLPSMPGWPAGPTDPAAGGMGGEFPNGNPSPYALRPVPLPMDQRGRPDIHLLGASGLAGQEERPDYGYPWNEPEPALPAPTSPPPAEEPRDANSSTTPLQPTHRPPAESDFLWPELSLDGNIAERSLQFYEWLGNQLGFELAPKHLRHYREGAGDPIEIARDEARRLTPFRNAEDLNRTRFEDSFTRMETDPSAKAPNPSAHGHKLLKLKDGESVTIEDNWDRGYDDVFKQIGGGYTPDFMAAFGRAKLKSEGRFTATRHGDEILIAGEATHSIDDRYDFNEGAFFHQEDKLLQERGARPFDRKGAWRSELTGTIRIKDGKLVDPAFVWKDVD